MWVRPGESCSGFDAALHIYLAGTEQPELSFYSLGIFTQLYHISEKPNIYSTIENVCKEVI